MSFDYFSKRRMQYILEKLKTIFDTKTETWTGTQAELAQQLSSIKNGTVINITDDDESLTTNLSALTDTDISSPIDGQGLVYDNTSEKWENKNLFSGNYNDLTNKPTIPSVIDNLTSTSTSDALSAKQGKVLKDAIDAKSSVFTLTLTQDVSYNWHCDKTPNEVISAYNAHNIIQIITDESESYNLTYYYLENSTLELRFSNCDINSDDTSVFYESEIYINSFKLVSDDLSNWDIYSCSSSIQALDAEIYEDDNVYHCDITPYDFISAQSNMFGMVTVFDDDGCYTFSKYDNGTYYFTSSNVNSSNELSIKTYAMTPNNDNSGWASIVKYETNGSGDIIWTGTTAEYESQASQIATGTIVNITDDIDNVPQFKVTNFAVGTTGWTTDTISQSGTTLYKKQISVNNIYSSPSVDIGASTGHILPTTDEQTAYNLLQYVTFDSSVPCLYLYAKSEPANTFNINVGGVD